MSGKHRNVNTMREVCTSNLTFKRNK